jgi:hypothetical protein
MKEKDDNQQKNQQKNQPKNHQERVISLQAHRSAEHSLNREKIQAAMVKAYEFLDSNQSIKLTSELRKIERALETGEEIGLILSLCEIYSEMEAYERVDEWLKEALDRLVRQSEEAAKNHTFQEEWLDHAREMMFRGLLINHNDFVSQVYRQLKWTNHHPEFAYLAGVAAFNREKYQMAARNWNEAFQVSQEKHFLQLQEVAAMVSRDEIPPFTLNFGADLLVQEFFATADMESLDLTEDLEKAVVVGGGKLVFLVMLFDEDTTEEEKEMLLAMMLEYTGDWAEELIRRLQKMGRFSQTFRQRMGTLLDEGQVNLPGRLPTSLPPSYDPHTLDEWYANELGEHNAGFRAAEEHNRQSVMEKNLPKKLTLKRGLKNMPVDWLRLMCSIHGLEEDLNRSSLEAQLEQYLLNREHLLQTLFFLEEDEWVVLQCLLKYQGTKEVAAMEHQFGAMEGDGYYWIYGQGPVSALGRLWLKGLLMVGSRKENQQSKAMVVVPQDLWEGLVSLWPQAEKQRLRPAGAPDESLSIAYLKAATNLYGVVTKEKLTEIYNTHHKEPLDTGYWLRYQQRRNEVFSWYRGHFVSNDVILEDCFETLLLDQQGKPHYLPEKKTFLKYQDDEYLEQTKPLQKLKRCLERNFHIPKKNLLVICEEIGFSARAVDTPAELVEELDAFGVRLDEPALLQEVSGILVEVMNHSRRWENCGHTPNEIFQQQHPEQVKTASEEKKVKVGRNEPCPCGSGKKYKRCCLDKEKN